MARLAVNIDHIATVREARGGDEPDPVLAAGLAELAGADCIICPLREDRRHTAHRELDPLRTKKKSMLSLFLGLPPHKKQPRHRTGADIVEIHTGHYSEARTKEDADIQFERIIRAVEASADLRLGISAGHGLNYFNIKRFRFLPQIEE